jgi:hypothetical protein
MSVLGIMTGNEINGSYRTAFRSPLVTSAPRERTGNGRPGGVTGLGGSGPWPLSERTLADHPGVTTQPGLTNTMPCGRKEGPASATRVSTPVHGFSVPR